MLSHTTSGIFVIGGTGAQGLPVIRGLVADKKYSVKVLTRDTTSWRAKSLLALSAAFADDEPRGDIERRQLDLRKEDHGREAGLEAPPGTTSPSGRRLVRIAPDSPKPRLRRTNGTGASRRERGSRSPQRRRRSH